VVSLGFVEADITDNTITKKVDLFGQKGLPFLKKPSTFFEEIVTLLLNISNYETVVSLEK
jgi:hypothetical protein